MSNKSPQPLILSNTLRFFAPEESLLPERPVLEEALNEFKVTGIRYKESANGAEWLIDFQDIREAEAAYVILQKQPVQGAIPPCRFELTAKVNRALPRPDQQTATLPQFIKSDEPNLLSTRELYDLFRQFGPLKRVDAAFNIGQKHPVAAVHFRYRKDALTAERFVEQKHPDNGTLQPFEPCSITCQGLGASFKKDHFELHFGAFGEFVQTTLINGGTPQAYGIIDFETPEQAESALFMNGVVARNSRISVRITEKKSLAPSRVAPPPTRGRRPEPRPAPAAGPPPPSPPLSPSASPRSSTSSAPADNMPYPDYTGRDEAESPLPEDAASPPSSPPPSSSPPLDTHATENFAGLRQEALKRIERARASLREAVRQREAAQAEELRARLAREAAEQAEQAATRLVDEALHAFEARFPPDGGKESSFSADAGIPGASFPASTDITRTRRSYQEAKRQKEADEAAANEKTRREALIEESRRKLAEIKALEEAQRREEALMREKRASERRQAWEAAERARDERVRREREEQERKEREEQQQREKEEQERKEREAREAREAQERREREEHERREREERERVEREEREKQELREREEREIQEAARRTEAHREAALKEAERCRLRDGAHWPIWISWTKQSALQRFLLVSKEFDETKFSEAQPLTRRSIPWPVLHPPRDFKVDELEWSMVEEFFVAVQQLMPWNDYKALVEKSHKRFHPDRWRSRALFATIFGEDEKKVIEDAGNKVAQALTPLWLKIRK